MKSKTGKYWLYISIGIIVNIFIFIFLSKKLEVYIVDTMVIDESVMTSGT
jgi:hypothetical protein